jgi:hypothetical protein
MNEMSDPRSHFRWAQAALHADHRRYSKFQAPASGAHGGGHSLYAHRQHSTWGHKRLQECGGVQDCSFFVNVIPPQQLTGSLDGRLPLIGNPVQLIACEDLLTNGHHCGETLATDSKLVPLVATYGVFVRSVAVFHTRAHSTDTTWVSVIGDTDISNLDKSKCRGAASHKQL